MIAPNLTDRKLIRLRFLGLYALSLACIGLIAAASLHKESPATLPPLLVQKWDTLLVPSSPQTVQAPVTDYSQAIEVLKKVIQGKDQRIAQLTEEARKRNAETATLSEKSEYHPAKGNSVEALKQSNVNLQLGFKDVMNKLWESYRAYNLLKKENAELRRQLESPN